MIHAKMFLPFRDDRNHALRPKWSFASTPRTTTTTTNCEIRNRRAENAYARCILLPLPPARVSFWSSPWALAQRKTLGGQGAGGGCYLISDLQLVRNYFLGTYIIESIWTN
jgi:hypothetical protein